MIREPISIMEVKCAKCHSNVILNKVYIDFQHCSFLIEGECLTCGHPIIVELSLEDFVDLDRLFNDGGKDGKK